MDDRNAEYSRRNRPVLVAGNPRNTASKRGKVAAIVFLLFTTTFAAGEDVLDRYTAMDGDQPFYLVWDQQTSEPVGVIYPDTHGLRMVDLTCGEGGFLQYAAGLVRLMNGENILTTGTVASDPTPRKAATATTDSSCPHSPVILQDMATTEVARLKDLVKEQGAVLAWRQFAREELIQGAKEIPDDPALFTIGGFGSFWGMRGRDDRLLHPKAMARRIQSHPEWQTSLTVVLQVSGVAESPFPEQLAKHLNTQVRAKPDLNQFHGFSDVDTQALSYRMQREFEAAAERSHGESAYVLSRHFESQAMINPDQRQSLEADARRWLKKAAEQGHAPAQYDLAYVSLWIKPLDIVTAERWIHTLQMRNDLTPQKEWKEDLDALAGDLEEHHPPSK